MSRRSRSLMPLADRGPLRLMFVITSMPIGGAETLLVNLIRRLDRDYFLPELCCLKAPGPLGEELAGEITTFSGLLTNKYDLRIWPRLTQLFRQRRIDAVVTVGAGDKMFWGRLAGWRAEVPVILSAIHSTGWPDQIGWLNRRLTRLTDAFVAVAHAHGRYLIEHERFPPLKVQVIPNGVDTERFAQPVNRTEVRGQLGISPAAPVAGIVAALRPEKNHALFLRTAALAHRQNPAARFLIVGDGPERSRLESLALQLGVADAVQFLGTRGDVPSLLAAMDVFLLTSHNEANPVSILEAMAAGKPIIAPRVGSIEDTVKDGMTGYLFRGDDAEPVSRRLVELFQLPDRARAMGLTGQKIVRERWSLQRMVEGYEQLIRRIYSEKCERSSRHSKAGKSKKTGTSLARP